MRKKKKRREKRKSEMKEKVDFFFVFLSFISHPPPLFPNENYFSQDRSALAACSTWSSMKEAMKK